MTIKPGTPNVTNADRAASWENYQLKKIREFLISLSMPEISKYELHQRIHPYLHGDDYAAGYQRGQAEMVDKIRNYLKNNAYD